MNHLALHEPFMKSVIISTADVFVIDYNDYCTSALLGIPVFIKGYREIKI
jgi:hypothetical protein